MAGGVGTRFWPASTRRRPKQFLSLVGDGSLLQQSYRRARVLTGAERVVVLTNADFVDLVREQLPELAPANVIGEPARRDTAAAACLAALVARRRFEDVVMVMLTADHLIAPASEFARTLLSACSAARGTSALYTVGIRPEWPATGYGYLECGQRSEIDDGVVHRVVSSYREKPDVATAKAYVDAGSYLWNSGMFVWRASAILAAFEEHLPGHVSGLSPVIGALDEGAKTEAFDAAFAGLPAISLDYAVMEKAADVRLVEATFRWSDLGGWEALAGLLPDDGAGNRHRARIAALDARDNVVYADGEDELVALLGVSDLVVVRSAGRTLVASRGRLEEVKELVRMLEREGREVDL